MRTIALKSDPVVAIAPLVSLLLTLLVSLRGGAGDGTLTMLSVVSLIVAVVCAGRIYFGLGQTAEPPSFAIAGAFLFWFYIPNFLTVVNGEGWKQAAAAIAIDNSHALKAFVALNSAYALTMISTMYRFRVRRVMPFARLLGNRELKVGRKHVLFILALTLTAIAFYVIISGGIGKAIQFVLASRTEKKPWEQEGYKGTALTPFSILSTSFLVASACISLHFALSGRMPKPRRIMFGIIAVVASFWVGVDSGTRTIIISATMPALLMFFRIAVSERATRRYTKFAIFGGLFLVLVAGGSFLRHYRAKASLEGEVKIAVQDNNLVRLFSFAIAIQEHEKVHTHESAIFSIITGPIPRVLWPNKPIAKTMLVFTRYVWGIDVADKGKNTLPSVLGQYYMSWGFWGVLEFGFFLGLIIRFLDCVFAVSQLRAMSQLGILGFVTYIFGSFRFMAFGFFGPAIMTTIMCALMARLSWLATRNTASLPSNNPGNLPKGAPQPLSPATRDVTSGGRR